MEPVTTNTRIKRATAYTTDKARPNPHKLTRTTTYPVEVSSFLSTDKKEKSQVSMRTRSSATMVQWAWSLRLVTGSILIEEGFSLG